MGVFLGCQQGVSDYSGEEMVDWRHVLVRSCKRYALATTTRDKWDDL
jgi:hypothetical protein